MAWTSDPPPYDPELASFVRDFRAPGPSAPPAMIPLPRPPAALPRLTDEELAWLRARVAAGRALPVRRGGARPPGAPGAAGGVVTDLALRLAALDPEATAALRVIAHFDQLSVAGAAVPTIVREAAALAGCPARLVDEERRLSVRAEADGTVRAAGGAPDPDWPLAAVPGEGSARMWLERPGPGGTVEAMVLERAAAAVCGALRGAPARPAVEDPAHLVDATAAEPDRLRAARRLGLPPNALVRAVAVPGASPYLEPVPAPTAAYRAQRAGIGPAVPVLDLPSSWSAARTALRFTAEGTPADPGPRTVSYEELGGLALLAGTVGPATAPAPDVRSLTQAAASAPWALSTLAAAAEADTLRAAAAKLRVHHSTLQYRLGLIEPQLGWTVRDFKGRMRLHVALMLRRLHQNPA